MSLTFNPVTREVVMYGGYNRDIGPSTVYLNDLWAFSVSSLQWRQLQINSLNASTGDSPIGALWSNFVTVQINGSYFGLLEGGEGSPSRTPNSIDDTNIPDMWLLNFTSMADPFSSPIWINVTNFGDANRPVASDGATMVVDSRSKFVYKFGLLLLVILMDVFRWLSLFVSRKFFWNRRWMLLEFVSPFRCV